MRRACIAVNEREENKGERIKIHQKSYMAHRESVAQGAGHNQIFVSWVSKRGETLALFLHS